MGRPIGTTPGASFSRCVLDQTIDLAATSGWYTLPPRLRVPPGQSIETELRLHPPQRARVADYPFEIRVTVDVDQSQGVRGVGRARNDTGGAVERACI